MYFFLVVMFYKYFIKQSLSKNLLGARFDYLIIIILFLFSLFLFSYNFSPSILYIPYFYLWFGIILIFVPLVIFLFCYPEFISKFFETAAYFFYLTLTYEITALQLGWWAFPSDQFIGWVSIWNVRFPIEELLFWMILCAMAVLTYYEFFDDGEK